MTALSPERLSIGAGTALLPRVNLLPPEIAEKRAFQQVQLGLGAAALCSAAVVGLLFLSASHSVTSANQDLAAAKANNVALQGQVTKYRDVTSIYAAAAAAQSQLTTAMGDEVRYSALLNDLALSVPSSVWLKSVTFTQTPIAPATAVPAPTAPGAAPTASSTATSPMGLGTFTVSGVGFTHDDVALWLESIAALKTYSNPYFSNSTEALLGAKKTVNFSSTAQLTSKALSNRYVTRTGG